MFTKLWLNGFRLEGKKVKKARDINRPVVNVQWLNEILFGHLSCMYQPENVKYQQFNLSNPFRVDYNLVIHLMGKILLIFLKLNNWKFNEFFDSY